MIRNKRGGIGNKSQMDILVGVMVFFVVILATAFAYFIIYQAQDKMAPVLNTNFSGVTNSDSDDTLTKAKTTIMMWNKLFYVLIIFFVIATIVTSYYLPSNPILFFLSLILLMITILLSAVFSNIFEKIVDTPGLENVSATFNISTLVMDKLPLVALVFGLVVLLVLYIKVRAG